MMPVDVRAPKMNANTTTCTRLMPGNPAFEMPIPRAPAKASTHCAVLRGARTSATLVSVRSMDDTSRHHAPGRPFRAGTRLAKRLRGPLSLSTETDTWTVDDGRSVLSASHSRRTHGNHHEVGAAGGADGSPYLRADGSPGSGRAAPRLVCSGRGHRIRQRGTGPRRIVRLSLLGTLLVRG